MFYKHKDEQEDREIANRIFTLDQIVKKKDNIIKRLEG
jgi:flagellar motor switch protein FliG